MLVLIRERFSSRGKIDSVMLRSVRYKCFERLQSCLYPRDLAYLISPVRVVVCFHGNSTWVSREYAARRESKHTTEKRVEHQSAAREYEKFISKKARNQS